MKTLKSTLLFSTLTLVMILWGCVNLFRDNTEIGLLWLILGNVLRILDESRESK